MTPARFTLGYEVFADAVLVARAQTVCCLFDFEAHVTMYPPGSFYVRHLDRFRDAPHRAVTAILYLNPAWTPDDGGALRLHLPGPDGGEIPHDVVPQAGTLVTFLSAEIPHEVLPTRRERLSFTGWFCTRR